VVYPLTSVHKTGFADYRVEIVALKRGNYTLAVRVANEKSPLSYFKLKSSLYAIYWESNLAVSSYSTAYGGTLAVVYTGSLSTFSL